MPPWDPKMKKSTLPLACIHTHTLSSQPSVAAPLGLNCSCDVWDPGEVLLSALIYSAPSDMGLGGLCVCVWGRIWETTGVRPGLESFTERTVKSNSLTVTTKWWAALNLIRISYSTPCNLYFTSVTLPTLVASRKNVLYLWIYFFLQLTILGEKKCPTLFIIFIWFEIK